ncbi:MAG: NACHT domain-containing protein [Ardenticatenaceae bacterium]
MSRHRQLAYSSRIVILLLMATVVPSLAIITFSEEITQYPAVALALGVVYELILLIIGLLKSKPRSGSGSRLESRSDNHPPQTVDWLEYEPQQERPISQDAIYRTRYFNHLIISHRHLDVTFGTLLQVEQLFVELFLTPLPPHKRWDDVAAVSKPIWKVPPALRSGKHSIWDYLNDPALAKQNLFLIGPLGSGKSTLLKHIALMLASDSSPYQKPNTLPILISLPDHAAAIKATMKDDPSLRGGLEHGFSLSDAVFATFSKNSAVYLEEPISTKWFKSQLERGYCLVLLDALDQVLDSHQKVEDWVLKQIKRWPNNRFIVTSRFGSGQELNEYRVLAGCIALQIRPLTNQQVTNLVHKWYELFEASSFPERQKTPTAKVKGPQAPKATNPEKANGSHNKIIPLEQKEALADSRRQRGAVADLLRSIHKTPSLSELAVNPLFLSMMATIHGYGGQLPTSTSNWVGSPPRVEVYEQIYQLFLEQGFKTARRKRKWYEHRALKHREWVVTPPQKRSILQPLAFHMMCNLQRDISSEKASPVIGPPLAKVRRSREINFLKIFSKTSGLLVESQSGVYMFAHPIFQAYVTTRYLLEQQLGDGLLIRVEDRWWHDTIRLYCTQSDATPFIEACLLRNSPTALTLAVNCLQEARLVEPSIEADLIARLQQQLQDIDRRTRRYAAEALLSLRLQRMRRVTTEKYVDDTLITHAEYQLFLDDEASHGRYYQPDHWLDDQFPEGTQNLPALGVSPRAALHFCEWLMEHKATTQWVYRLPKRNEFDSDSVESNLDRRPFGATVPELVEGQDMRGRGISQGYWVMSGEEFECIYFDSPRLPIMTSERLWELVNHDRALAFDESLDRDLADSLGLDLNGILKRYAYRALDRYHFLDSYLNRALGLVSDRPYDLDRYRARNLTGYRDLDPSRARELARYRNLDIDQYLYDDLNRALYLVLNLERDLYLDPAIALNYNRYEVSRFLRWYIRFCTLILGASVAQIMVEEPTSWVAPVQIGARSGLDYELESLISTYTELYVTFAILEERTQGNEPAFEGIRLVMEKKKEQK